MREAHDGRRLGGDRLLLAVAFFGFAAAVLWAMGTTVSRLLAALSAAMVVKALYEAVRPPRRGVGPPPTDRETALLLERHMRTNQMAGAMGGALGGVIGGAGALGGGAGAVGGSRGGRRGRYAFDRSPSFVIERTFATSMSRSDIEEAVHGAVRSVGAHLDVEPGVPTLLTRLARAAVFTWSIDEIGPSRAVKARVAERSTSKLADALIAALERSFGG